MRFTVHRPVAIAAAIVVSALMAACDPPRQVDIVARLVSPDGQIDAVHAQPKTDATVGFVDWVYIVPHGAKLSGKPIFIADHVSPDLAVEWSSSRLTIKADSARVFTSVPEAEVGGRVTPVEVLIPVRQQ